MPYVKQCDRDGIEPHSAYSAETAGDLNYQFTRIINKYLHRKPLKYSEINAVIGALECCKLELYRRVAVPYEDIKREENGDVYTTGEGGLLRSCEYPGSELKSATGRTC